MLPSKFIVMFFCVFFVNNNTFSMDPEQDIYNNANVFSIFSTEDLVEKCTKKQKLALKEFSDYSAEKQREFLESEYNLIKDRLISSYIDKKKSIQLSAFYRNSKLTILTSIMPMALFFFGDNLFQNNNLLGMVAVSLAIQGINAHLTKSLDALSNAIFPPSSIISSYEIQYIGNKIFYSSDFQNVFENKVLAARKNTFYISEYVSWFKTALSLPLFKNEIKKDYIESLKNDEILKNLDENTFLSIKRICQHHHSRENTRNIVYFHGEPGVGKTKSAERIAVSLGLPLGKIFFSNLSHNELLGASGTHQAAPGKILEAITHPSYQESLDSPQAYTNMVILIDEADRVLNDEKSAGIRSLLLSLLDPETTKFYSPYLESYVTIKNMLFILTGNELIKDIALTDRMDCVNFPGFSHEQKISIGFEEAHRLLKNSKIDISKFNKTRQKSLKYQLEKSNSPSLRNVKKIVRSFVDSIKEEMS